MDNFHLDFSPLKDPLGFIKLLEWLFSICVFATCGTYKGETTVLVSCGQHVNKTVTAAFAYPFRLNEVRFTSPDPTQCGGTWIEYYLVGDFSSAAQFFVTLAVLIFLYCLAALVVYFGYMHLYQNISTIPMMDYVITLCATFLWLVSTAAWAKALVDIKVSTGPDIVDEMAFCKRSGSSCLFASVTSMRSLNVSVAFGLVNIILWGGNAWFVHKETSLHKSRGNAPNSGLYPPASGI